MYDNYIFDLYGTLADIRTNESKAYLWRKMSEFYSSMGAAYGPRQLRREFRRLERESTQKLQREAEHAGKEDILAEPDLTEVFGELFAEKGIPCDRQTARLAAVFFRTLSRQYLQVYDGVKETLAQLRSRGKGVYLLSNAQSDFTRPELELMGLTEAFDGILISSEEGCRKPSPAFFRRLLERYHLDPAECLMVGNDEDSDIGGAAGAGMDSLYLHTATSSPLKGSFHPTYCVPDGDWQKVKRILLESGREEHADRY